MIAVSQIVAKLRSRLGDNTPLNYKWSDPELMDNINSALIQLSVYLLASTKVVSFKVLEGVNRYKLPDQEIAKYIGVTLNGEPCVIKSFEWVQNNKARLDKNEFTVCFDEISLYIYGDIKADDTIELAYNYIQKVDDLSQNIDMSAIAEDAIVFYAMYMSLQVNTSDKNAAKSIRYLEQFKEQVAFLTNTFFRKKHSKKLNSKYKRV
jgi:hypothetical protein